MSNQSNNNRFNSSRDRSFFGNSNSEGNTTKDTFIKNGSNIILKDYNNYAPPSSLVGGGGNDSVNPYVMDSKIKELESKLETLEQTNKILIERINNNETNFTLQLNKLQKNNDEERENRYKAEKALNIISEQSNAYSNDLNMKINMLQDAMVKGDENKSQQRQFDLESQKYLIGKLTEKITKTVKSEVEARYKADMDGKIFSQRLNNKFESSLDILKKEIEEITNQTKVEMQKITKDCSERTHNVSKYVDQKISEAVFGKGSSNEELKNFVKKLTEQLKNSLISISKKNEMIETRLENLENGSNQNKTENRDFMTETENRLMKKINDVKLYTEVNIRRHDEYLNHNMKNMINKINENIQYIAVQLIDTRNRLNERFEKIFKDHREQYSKICIDLQEVCNRLYKDEHLFEVYENKYMEVKKEVNDALCNIYAREDIQIVQERIIKTIECNFLQAQINNINEALLRSNTEFKANMDQSNKEGKDSFQQLIIQLKEQERKMNEMKENNKNKFEEMKKGSDAIEVNQIINEMVSNVENSIVLEQIQNRQNAEENIKITIENQKNQIMDSLNKINTNKEDISELKNKVNFIQNSLNVSGANMSGMKDQMEKMREEAKELEMKESVDKIMDLMITNVEMILNKEKMDKMSQFDLSRMSETILQLQDKVNSFSKTSTDVETITKDIQNLYEQQEYLKNRGGGDDVKLATIQMLNNVEFENIYSILNSNNLALGSVQTTEMNEKTYNEIVDNKINKALEKIKSDNENMWTNSVMMKDKVTDPEEIKKIINQIPPGVNQTNESLRKLMEVGALDEQSYTPKVNGLDNARQRSNESNYYGDNYNNQQDPGPDIASKKSSKKSSKKGKNNENNINEQNNNISNPNQENKSKKSSKNNPPQENLENKSKKSSKNNAPQNNLENKSKKSSKNNAPQENLENKSKKSNKNNAQQANEENNSKKNDNKLNLQSEDNNNNLDSNGSNPENGEEEGDEEEGGEIDDNEEENLGGDSQEALPGRIKKANKESGKNTNLLNK